MSIIKKEENKPFFVSQLDHKTINHHHYYQTYEKLDFMFRLVCTIVFLWCILSLLNSFHQQTLNLDPVQIVKVL